jgi:hypothetical protein
MELTLEAGFHIHRTFSLFLLFHWIANSDNIQKALFAHSMMYNELYTTLLYQAIQISLALGMNDNSKVRLQAMSGKEEEQIRKMFMILYSMEKPLSLRLGRQSVRSSFHLGATTCS